MPSCAQHRSCHLNTTTIHHALRWAMLSALPGFIFLVQSSAIADNRIVEIPLEQPSGWQKLTYNGIRSNQVSYSDSGLLIEVDQSASPLIYPFPETIRPAEISLSLQIRGGIDLDGRQQGDKGSDDFVFRLGLVHEGEKTLNFMQRAIAAGWIKKLFSMAPEGTGIDTIQFYNVYSDARLAGQSRVHPLSDLMVEHFIAARPQTGSLELTFEPDTDSPVLALWISIDGDDTKSSYEVLIERLQITTR